ncbi:3-deoxy-7-phosphoheptulonate synthase [Nakamurella antarctica]|uniref:Phospho-2-dehydro-3-deoxyheptonate aldolase n=1 Tax=Nakamurella antarctica TaxID=1902245 RepID=A0A3G8ZNK1_9ACTN|nr:3-deoxy-7-phosphoheptulonate synthase [Nakamurella antarctica]AZI58912.1 3-deoxy-7-phosphoheptulonate synthase [Nakamurella antarctica]
MNTASKNAAHPAAALWATPQSDPVPNPHSTTDLQVKSFDVLPTPAAIRSEFPLGPVRAAVVSSTREAIRGILAGTDDRLLIVIGPCSVHDVDAALDYARALASEARLHAEELLIVMRVYFEKPRTTVGWKGLINDPGLDGSYDVQRGLRTARQLLLDILDLGIGVACEFLEPISPQYIADAVSWGAIGARTTESPVHRQLASGLSMPVGFKNGTDGDVQIAIDAMIAAGAGQAFFGVDDNGRAAVVSTRGNPDTHVITRGGRGGPNYSADHTRAICARLTKAGLPARVVVDASHANSGKDHIRQAVVAGELAAQVASGEAIAGIMLESFLVAGRQNLPIDVVGGAPQGSFDVAELVYGQSVTDACMGWECALEVLGEFAQAVTSRRRSDKSARVLFQN